jgi:ATP-dependent RNA helicase DDX19/DBP5
MSKEPTNTVEPGEGQFSKCFILYFSFLSFFLNLETAEVDASLLRKILRSRLVETSQAIEIERKNVDSPLYSVKTFEELNLKPDLLQGIYAMGFTRPSKIQETALPALINNPPQNLIAQSQSGTGKTAAFTLTMLSRVDPTQTYPQVKLKIRRNLKL